MGSDSKFFLPIIIGQPKVSDLKCLNSLGRCQHMSLSFPITLFSAFATIKDFIIILIQLLLYVDVGHILRFQNLQI